MNCQVELELVVRYFKSLESLFLYLVGGRYDMFESRGCFEVLPGDARGVFTPRVCAATESGLAPYDGARCDN
jgi:hypothetical protein